MSGASRAAPELLLATLSPDKQRRLRWIVAGLPFRIFTPTAADAAGAPAERGATHRDIAAQKAAWWSGRRACLALASDGGVEIPALGAEWRSVRTRRASGASTDAERVADLLRRLAGAEGEERSAWWIEALALAHRGALVDAWEARGPRLQVREQEAGARPEGGFWLETLLADPASGRALATMSARERRPFDRPWLELRRRARRRLLDWKAQQEGARVPVR